MRSGTGNSRESVEERSEQRAPWDTPSRTQESLPPYNRSESAGRHQEQAGSGTGYMALSENEPREGELAPSDAVPPQRDVLNHANFGLLPQEKGRLRSFGVAAGINVVIAILAVFLTLEKVHEVSVHRQEQLTYIEPPPVKPYIPPPPKVQMPPVPELPKEEAKIPPPPKPVPEPPKPEIKVETKAPAMAAPAPRPVVTPPRPVVGAFKAATPAEQAPKVAAQTKAAGFGNPVGAHPTQQATNSQVPVTGGFGAAANTDQGAASRRGAVASTGFGAGTPAGSPNGSSRGVVASTGFGSGSQPAGQPGGRGQVASTGFGAGTARSGSPGEHGTVASTGFGAARPEAGAPAARAQQVATTPIVVTVKPLPQYTAEARAAHVEGDVQLEVRFTADGQVEVLRVVRGLGYGLDQQARVAAERIRFKPATRDGKPVDQVSIIHVTFQLA